MNGYNNHSPTNGTGFLMSDGYLGPEKLVKHNICRRQQLTDEYSNAGSDMDDEDMAEMQPPSPSGPLSLTTQRKHSSRDNSPRPSTPPLPLPLPPDIQVSTYSP